METSFSLFPEGASWSRIASLSQSHFEAGAWLVLACQSYFCAPPSGESVITEARKFSSAGGRSEPSVTSKKLKNGHPRLGKKIKVYVSYSFYGVANHLVT